MNSYSKYIKRKCSETRASDGFGSLEKKIKHENLPGMLSEKGTDYSIYIIIFNSPVSLQPKSVKLNVMFMFQF